MKILRNPLVLFATFLFLVWLFQQLFLSFGEEENVPIYSHHKKGNRAFSEFASELGVSVIPLFVPAYEWHSIKGNKSGKPKEKKQTYVLAEPTDEDEFIFWHSPEIPHYRDFLKQGNDMVIFTNDPTLYWSAFFLPPNPLTAEKKIVSQTNAAIALSSAIETETDIFLWDTLSSPRALGFSAIAQKADTAFAHQCELSEKRKTFLLTSRFNGYATSWDSIFTESGWSLQEECYDAHKVYMQKWKVGNGNLTFVSTRDIVQNNLIAEARNIFFLDHILKLSQGSAVLWDEYHRGVFREPNLWYYLTQTLPGRLLLWLLAGLVLYYFFRNRKLRRFALRKPRGKITARAVVRYEDLALSHKENAIIDAAYETLQKIHKLNKTRSRKRQDASGTQPRKKEILKHLTGQ